MCTPHYLCKGLHKPTSSMCVPIYLDMFNYVTIHIRWIKHKTCTFCENHFGQDPQLHRLSERWDTQFRGRLANTCDCHSVKMRLHNVCLTFLMAYFNKHHTHNITKDWSYVLWKSNSNFHFHSISINTKDSLWNTILYEQGDASRILFNLKNNF